MSNKHQRIAELPEKHHLDGLIIRQIANFAWATDGSKDITKAAKMLREYKISMLRGHGCFSIGPVLEEAFQCCSSLEESCKIGYYTQTLQAAQATISQRGLGNLETVNTRKITRPGKKLT